MLTQLCLPEFNLSYEYVVQVSHLVKFMQTKGVLKTITLYVKKNLVSNFKTRNKLQLKIIHKKTPYFVVVVIFVANNFVVVICYFIDWLTKVILLCNWLLLWLNNCD